MAGALKLWRGERKAAALCLPDELGWRLGSQSIAPDRLAEVPPGTWIGLPARHLLSVPIWLQSGDPSMLRDLAAAQLERRGLLRRETTTWDCLPICQEEGRSLVAAFVVDESLPASLHVPQAGAYEVAARCRPLPESAYLLWREHGGIALACTRAARLAFLRFFPEAADLEAIAEELGTQRRMLEWEEIAAPGASCVLWGDFSGSDRERARAAFGAEPSLVPAPAPAPPPSPLSLLPPEVRAARREKETRQQRQGLLLYAGTAYAVLLFAALGAWGWHAWQARRFSQELALHAGEVDRLLETAERWKAIQPAVDPSYYPLECLLALVKALPQEVRFTQFEHGPGKVLVLGEGKDAAAIFRFFDAVKADPFLKKWTWALPQPQLLPNNRAQFHLEGTREPAPTQ